jgi:predicted enzyme related to lactoylglutathione lyase
MSTRDEYQAGVPCWVETLQPDPRPAMRFYGALFGWQFSEPETTVGGLGGEYVVARVDGRTVAGIGTLPALDDPPTPGMPVWSTYICVETVTDAADQAAGAGGRLLRGPVDAGPAGRWAALLDPTGAAFGVWEAGDRAGAQLVNEPRTWTMSALHTPDPAAAAAFYGAVFGWGSEPIAPGTPVSLFRLSGYIGGEPGQAIPRDVVAVMTSTAQGPDGPSVPPHWNVNLLVDDSDDTAARAVELGGRILIPPTDSPGFRSAVLMDPQGAAFSISHMVTAA